MRLVVLLVLMMTGGLLGSGIIIGILLMNGASLSAVMDSSAMYDASPMMTRLITFFNHVPIFLIPGLIWAIIYHKKEWSTYLNLNIRMQWIHVLMGIAFLIVAYPLVSKSAEWNQSLDLPSWMTDMSIQTEGIIKKILTMDHIGILMINLILIGILPGIGEELIFRGIIQKELQSWIRNPYLAIVLTAMLFSAIHFQFDGFLPRWVLGLILGLLYYWTGNLWISMVVHAFNNGLQVLLTYFDPTMIDQDIESAVPIKWYILILSLLLTGILSYWFKKQHALKQSIIPKQDISQQNMSFPHE